MDVPLSPLSRVPLGPTLSLHPDHHHHLFTPRLLRQGLLLMQLLLPAVAVVATAVLLTTGMSHPSSLTSSGRRKVDSPTLLVTWVKPSAKRLRRKNSAVYSSTERLPCSRLSNSFSNSLWAASG
ncbi:uncharacterized protein M6B38_340580 [Iris pallida]|uniref:Uncharacterized protein n=1 Tax=Iris pallida TaxID=29817 RepID=A0AAX6GX55_IRIPA|nr:uncharacterized protein M6B38_340580 [Iris pallida]